MATEKRLIDANALTEQFDECNFKGFVLRRLIEMQPTVDAVEVVHGRWISHEYDMAYSCSTCKYITDWHLSNYCPQCGAKMDGDRNG